MVKDFDFSADELAHLINGAIELAFEYSRLHGKTEVDSANFAIREVFESLENSESNESINNNDEYNAALEWAASWITGAQMLGHSAEVIEFSQNMAMSIRAAKRPTKRAADGASRAKN